MFHQNMANQLLTANSKMPLPCIRYYCSNTCGFPSENMEFTNEIFHVQHCAKTVDFIIIPSNIS